jgi:peptidoglycan/LPS O-acetylase OafA/YrhL
MWGKEYAPTSAPYLNFIISRFWRLMPIYYVALVLYYVVDYLFPTSGRNGLLESGFWTTVHFYISQIFILGYAPLPSSAKIIPPVWSLDIELQFYLVAPLIIVLLQKYSAISLPRLALYGIALVGFGTFVVFFGNILAQSAFLPMYLAFFLIGLHSAHYEWKPSEALAVSGLGLAMLLIVGCIWLPATRPLLIEGSFSGWLTNYNPDACIILALLVAPYAMATVRKTPMNGSWFAKIDRDFSNITYEIYLSHVSVLAIVEHFVGNLSKYQQLPALVLAWIGVLPLCWIVYRFIDRPIDQLRSTYVKSRQRRMLSVDNDETTHLATAPLKT